VAKIILAPEVVCEHCEEDYFKGIEEMVRNYEASRLVNDDFESLKQSFADYMKTGPAVHDRWVEPTSVRMSLNDAKSAVAAR